MSFHFIHFIYFIFLFIRQTDRQTDTLKWNSINEYFNDISLTDWLTDWLTDSLTESGKSLTVRQTAWLGLPVSGQGHTDDPNRFGPWGSSERFAQKVIYIGQIEVDFKLTLMELCNPGLFPRVIVSGLDQSSKDCLYGLAACQQQGSSSL